MTDQLIWCTELHGTTKPFPTTCKIAYIFCTLKPILCMRPAVAVLWRKLSIILILRMVSIPQLISCSHFVGENTGIIWIFKRMASIPQLVTHNKDANHCFAAECQSWSKHSCFFMRVLTNVFERYTQWQIMMTLKLLPLLQMSATLYQFSMPSLFLETK